MIKNYCIDPQVIELGKFIVDTWYYSPYPEPYASADKLYLCEFTLKYFRRKKTLLKHKAMLQQRHPPGKHLLFLQLDILLRKNNGTKIQSHFFCSGAIVQIVVRLLLYSATTLKPMLCTILRLEVLMWLTIVYQIWSY